MIQTSFFQQGSTLWPVYTHHVLSSTQREAEVLLHQKHPAPFVVMAEQQSQGRGQWERTWHSPVGHFYGSFALYGASWPQPLGHAALVGGIAVLQAIQSLSESKVLNLTLKWPNDVLIDGQKVSGLLCEVYDPQHMIMGIGVNLAPLEADHPPQATSLHHHGLVCTSQQFLEALIPQIDHGWHQWFEHGASYVLSAYAPWGTIPDYG